MGKRYFTDEQVEKLLLNPYVKKASTKAITYTQAFKEHFIREYELGVPIELFLN